MTSLTEYFPSTKPAPPRTMKTYTKTLFVMGQSTSGQMTEKSVPTSQPGSNRRPLKTFWILTIVNLHARIQSMDVKPAPIKSILSSVLEMEP